MILNAYTWLDIDKEDTEDRYNYMIGYTYRRPLDFNQILDYASGIFCKNKNVYLQFTQYTPTVFMTEIVRFVCIYKTVLNLKITPFTTSQLYHPSSLCITLNLPNHPTNLHIHVLTPHYHLNPNL